MKQQNRTRHHLGQQGFTLIELLVAMVMIGAALTALMFSQASNYKVSAQARHATVTKAGANLVLERMMDKVLKVYVNNLTAIPAGSTAEFTSNSFLDQTSALFGRENVKQSYVFLDYYYNCPTQLAPIDPDGNGPLTALRGGNIANLRSVLCAGGKNDVDSVTPSKIDPNVSTSWKVVGETGYRGEGVLRITVTATHSRGAKVTVVNRISCYDIYPSPTSDVPAPCPPPGGGR
jgi:prepilin-type N-terminal cleavage/methylation domain-containing protein